MRYDYQQQQEEDERHQREERWAEALAMDAAIEAHRKWKEKFNAEHTQEF